MITGNKGEWSEIYALFKLLGDGRVFAGDADLNKIENLFYPIINILRTEETGSYSYKLDGNIVVVSEDGNEIKRISVDIFSSQAVALLAKIKSLTGSSFSIPETQKFMESVNCHTLKAKSEDKTDIKIIIHDLRTNMQPLLGFSIKSQVGNPSTLINSSSHTNLSYKIIGTAFNVADIAKINSINTNNKIRDRVKEIENRNGILQFSHCESPVFKNNLILIDGCMPHIVAEIMKIYYGGQATEIKDIVEQLEEANPLGFDQTSTYKFYEHKVKRLLTDAALGMKPATPWTGIYEATGGYLVVKEDGDVLCYHIYNKNDFENYLYANTKLETPSSSRHRFGIIETINGEQIFKLNLQIRFIT